MSFILKALKKVEREKRAKEMGEVALNSAILASEGRPLSKSGRFHRYVIILIPLVVVAGVLSYFLFTAPSLVEENRTIAPGAVQQGQSAPSRGGIAGEEKGASPEPAVVRGVSPLRENETMRPAEADPGRGATLRPTDRKGSSEPHPETKSRAIPLREPEPVLVGAPSSLVVNGIALQDEPAESVAVVNGRILKKGMTIEGAEVDRIFLDRVRFRGNGGVFEVHLAK